MEGSPSRAAPRGLLSTAATVFATGLGSGFSPRAPGTAGTALGLLFYWPLSRLDPGARLAVAAAVFVLGIASAGHVARLSGRHDPGIVVIDEVVGLWVSLLFLPLTPLVAALGFLSFRLLDMVKPWPARQLEALPGGLGIMADDLMAGLYANLALRVVFLVLPPQ